MERVRIGILGAGHLGRIHVQQCLEVPQLELIGFYDPHEEKRNAIQEEFGIAALASPEAVIDPCDAVSIVTPTLAHYDMAVMAMEAGKHVFIEKPITDSVQDAEHLIELQLKHKVKAQVGHVERFNPALLAVRDAIQEPMFIETHRLAQFNPRGTDVSVVLDLMIHDIDITLSLVKSEVRQVHASGVSVVSDTPDITNARIEFENGCVANLTASRISMKNMRKSRFFQKDAYISVDMLEKKSEIVRMERVIGEPDPFAVTIDLGEDRGRRSIQFDRPEVKPINAIREELRAFADCILNDGQEVVSALDGMKALRTAHLILAELQQRS